MALLRITENLTFDSINRILISDRLPGSKKTLGLAAAFCLECLTEARGETVSQEKLIHEGWQKHGFEVSPGNVRQVISQIRKSFSSLKESPDLLITVPKMGYRLNIQSPAPAPAISDAETLIHTPAPGDAPVHPMVTSPLLLALSEKGFPRTRWQRLAICFLSIVLVMCSVMAAVNYFLPFILNRPPAVNYQVVTSSALPGKKVLVDTRFARDRQFIDDSTALLVRSAFWKEDSARYDWIYLNGNANKKMHSFFLCDRDVKETLLNCVNRIFIEE